MEEIISFIKEHPDKSIGIITPFTNQKELINKALKDNGMENIPCGTVHAFQGDEKDVVLFRWQSPSRLIRELMTG